jgi:hypothetical protein
VRSTAFTTPKSAVLAPIPSASVSDATVVNPDDAGACGTEAGVLDEVLEP